MAEIAPQPEPCDVVEERKLDVVVVGAGISGLACAYACNSLGMRVAVFDGSDAPGGNIRTVHAGGHIIEGGPQSFLSAPALDHLIDALGLRAKVVASAAEAKRRYVFTRHGLIAMPASPQAGIMSPLISTSAKWRLLRELFVPKRAGDDEESVASFVRRRAGREIVGAIAAPFLAGIHAGDVEKVSLRSAFPALDRMEREHGSVLRALMRSRRSRTRPLSFSFADGNHVLPSALASALGKSLFLRSPVERVDVAPDGVTINVGGAGHSSVRVARVVIAAPAAAAARLIAPFAPDAARALSRIEYAPLVQIALAYPRATIGVPLDGFAFLATRDAGVRVLGAVWNSVAFPERAAKNDVLVTAFVGGAVDRALAARSDDELVELVHADLCKVMKIDGACPRLAAIFRWEPGIPQYNVGHEERLRTIDAEMAQFPAVMLSGNFLRGVSIGDCVRQAREIALRISQTPS
ncbi:MAG TPA: protoporphyrinogen oxidase [Candidatus Eremiobacteraceae bacterium]|nr:protoporphyrinogen oxidase [Candidatus Eremiobacteraceae bacterium]